MYLEDHYWDKKDAAVVFKRVDFATGDTRLIYHGNDGTHMPWNDTAQLDFLNPETREAVIQTILHVARMFPAHPLRRRHDPGEEALPAPLVSRARAGRRHPLPGRATA